ncbi:hypothetical protein [Oceanibaculum nanhaiense]|uniref:hypothetical protein n=1 Tax=Oceanibaculum nanhaiense TaxID=1909734 RepID=UPI003D2DEB93
MNAARHPLDYAVEAWRIEPDWRGETVVIAAGGPSLTADQLAMVRAAGCRLIVVNNAWQIAPWADLLYACDRAWWQHYRPAFPGEKATISPEAAFDFGSHWVRFRKGTALSRDPDHIALAANGGHQALGIAAHRLGFEGRILLLGFDMKPGPGSLKHWHGSHPGPLDRGMPFGKWIADFAVAANSLPPPLTVINCTPGSALRCFPVADLADALAGAAGRPPLALPAAPPADPPREGRPARPGGRKMSLALQIARTALLKPQPGDVLVVTMNQEIDDRQVAVLHKRFDRALSAHPGVSVLIVGRHDRVTIEVKSEDGKKLVPKPEEKPAPPAEAATETEAVPSATEAATEEATKAQASAAEAEGATAKPQRRRSTGGKKAAGAKAGA